MNSAKHSADLTFKPTPWVESGPDSFRRLPELVERWKGTRIFAVVDAAVMQAVAPMLEEMLSDRLCATRAYDHPGEPTIAWLDRVADEARAAQSDLVIGIGGGSAMDTAKGVSILLGNPGSGADYQGFGRVEAPGAATILVPTTAGSGSEATWSAVFINEDKQVKRGINGHQVFATATILDPQLTLGLPPRQTAISGMDALIHAVESYATRNASALSRMYSVAAMQRIFPALPRAVQDPGDLDARADMILGSYLAGTAIMNSEVGLSHAMSYPLSVRHRIPHGLGNALLFAETTKYNSKECPEVYDEIARLAQPGGGLDAKGLPGFISDYVAGLGLVHRLDEWVDASEVATLAEEAIRLEGPVKNHRRPVSAEDLDTIYRACMEIAH